MATTRTVPFDPAKYLADPAEQVALLTDALATGNAAYIANALGTIARARGMSTVARGAGVTREALYKSLKDNGDPKLTTVMGVLKTLKIALAAHPEPAGPRRRNSPAKARPPTRPSARPPGRTSRAA